MKKINRIGGIIALAFLISMVVIGIYKRHLLLNNFEITTGEVTEITPPGWKNSGDYSVLYEYKVKGKMYRSNNNYNYCRGQNMTEIKSLLVGKQFPVAYAVKDASTGTILLKQEDADRFKYQLPDSVRYYDSVLSCK